MKKSFFREAILLVIGLMIFQLSARAEMIKGEVRSISNDAQSFALKRPGLIGRELTISLRPGTAFEGISSLKELAVGDEVEVDAAKKDKAGDWEANSIRISKVKIYRGGSQ